MEGTSIKAKDPFKSQSRNKRLSRFYFSVLTLLFLVVFLDSVISLATFGAKQSEIKKGVSNSDENCILFSNFLHYDDKEKVVIQLSRIRPCAFVLWGLTSVMIVSVVWLVYSIILTVVGPSVISLLRILDLFVLLFIFITSLCVSGTIQAGLSKTCGAWKKTIKYQCSGADLITNEKNTGIKFYDVFEVSQNSSWVATILYLILSVWTVLLLVVYCCRKKHRSRVTREAVYGTMPSSSSSSPSSESDCDSDSGERKRNIRKNNPFTHT